MNRKWKAFLCGLSACILAGCGGARSSDLEQPAWHLLSACPVEQGIEVEIGAENLLLKKGVKITADSQESEEFAAKLAADGISDRDSLRWSSENNWENNEHWLQVEFGEKTGIGHVKIFWERTNACSYALEYSADGKNWNTAASFDTVPESKEQNICLETPVNAEFLRLHVFDVTKEEEDLSLYYQNVSVLEMEVYGETAERFVVEVPEMESGEKRRLSLPKVPPGYEISFGGADYENLITADGVVADTLSPVTAEVGFVLHKEDVSWELPGASLVIPASEAAEAGIGQEMEGCAPLGVMEWKAAEGSFVIPDSIVLEADEGKVSAAETKTLSALLELFGRELEEAGLFEAVLIGSTDGAAEADSRRSTADQTAGIVLELTDSNTNALGDEGFEICVDETQIRILGNTVQALRWGCVTLLDWIEQADAALAVGTARDYPKYSVRGFGIDVGRRAISLELLYRIVEALSAEKMNTLQIHLNDNQIIAQSQYDGTVDGARNLYAGFRLESDMKNEAGEGITSQDLFYTKQEFEQLIDTAAVYGVEIVPEIDIPAHSLAFTKVFPELGFSKDPESVDQLDLSKEKARQLGKDIWTEYLNSAFADCTAVHLGMDEYYGKETAYVEYLQELSEYVKNLAPEKELRIWGSLSKIEADYSSVSRKLQMHVWDTDWANPQDMYEEGFPIINSQSSSLYIIPGGGYDQLDVDFLEKEWEPNLFFTEKRNWELPAWSERMLGACYMMWNDWSWMNGDEITEDSLFERFEKPLGVLAYKLWGNSISF